MKNLEVNAKKKILLPSFPLFFFFFYQNVGFKIKLIIFNIFFFCFTCVPLCLLVNL